MNNFDEIMQHMAKGGYRVHQEWGLMSDMPKQQLPVPGAAPDCPQIHEQPVLVDEGHARRMATHGAAGGRDE